MMLWLLNYLGVKGLAKWAVRLVALVFATFLVAYTVYELINNKAAQNAAWLLGGLALVVAVARWVLARRGGQREVFERTIDGKIVPENLAVAALAVPEQSPDFEYVMRGLPDYSKMMLKLDAAAFEYVPEVEEKRLEAPIEEPAEAAPSLPWFGLPRWALAAGAAGLLVVAGVGTWHSSRGSSAPPDVSQPVAATETATPAVQSAQSPTDDANTVAAAQQPAAPAVQESAPPPASAPEAAPARSVTAAPREKALAGERYPANNSSGDLPSSADSRPSAEVPTKIWLDVTTGLIWPKRDNGREPLENWQAAKDYCNSLNIDGLTGWRLPEYKELESVLDTYKHNGTFLGGIRLSQSTEFLWSADTVVSIDPDRNVADVYRARVMWIVPGSSFDKAMDSTPPPPGDRLSHAICVQ